MLSRLSHSQVLNSTHTNTPSGGSPQPTLLSFVTAQGRADPDLALALDALASACKRISLAVRRAPIERLTGYLGSSVNTGGERQKKLDVLSNDLIKESLADSGRVAAFASEEEDGVVRLTEGAPLVVACDPLDGSSNVDCSVPTGTIFGVYGALGQDDDARESDRRHTSLGLASLFGQFNDCRNIHDEHTVNRSVLQKGRELLAGGYCLYASTTLFVLALKGKGTHVFALDPAVGDFVLQRAHVQIPPRGASYSLNEGREADWPEGLRRYVNDMKQGLGQTKTPYDLVYVCSLVADVHYVLQRGGMACNPRSHLRLIYEGNPMALVVEEAGGLSSTGGGPRERRILDVVPQAVHERIPTFVGSRDDILELESYGDVAQEGTKVYASVQQG